MKPSITGTQPADAGSEGSRGGGDPLSAMYVIAALLMFVAGVVVVALMFVPSDWMDRLNSSGEAYVPGSGPSFEPLSRLEFIPEAPGVRQVEPGVYLAVIEAYNWEFKPTEIRVPVGSEVIFRARSVDDFHGIALVGTQVILSLGQDEMKEARYTFDEPGEYLWVCSEYCGAGHANMMGHVIVE